ncbi:17534_t:CDS:2, partial [Funneliformis caledonium]
MEENFQETYDHDPVFSKFSEDTFNSEIPNIKLNEAVKIYAKQQSFQVCLGKIEKNIMGQIHKRTIVYNREVMDFERIIPIEIQERILLLRHTGCNIPTIQAILKEEFSDI